MAIATVIQFDPRECGPAALAMVLAHYDRPVDLLTLAAACQVEVEGSRASRLLQVARAYGLAAKAIRLTPANAPTTPTPFIAHWLGDHFVVVEEIGNGRVTLNDPAFGRRSLTYAEFAQDFSGVALLFSQEKGTQENFPSLEQNPSSITHHASRITSDDPLVRALQAAMVGAVGWLPWQVAAYQQDFGHLYQKTPRAVVKAICEEDVVHTLKVARPMGVTVTTRGLGHARHGQSLNEGGIVLVNFLDAPLAQWQMVNESQVEVTARSRWAAVERELNGIGRAMPTLPAYGRLSVGGTLSVGGYGERSIQHGSQIHHVRRLRLVLPDGTAVYCSAHENGELFRYSLAGLGQVGVIEKVVIETVVYQPLAEPLYYHHASPAAFHQSLTRLTAEPAGTVPHYAGYVLKDQGCFSELRYPLGVAPLALSEVEQVGERPAFRGQDVEDTGYRLAADFLFDGDGLAAYLDFLQEIWQTTPLGNYTDWALVLAVRGGQSGVNFPFEAVPVAPGYDGMAYLVGLYPVIPLGDEAGLAAVQAIFGRALRRAIELGGRPYRYGSHDLDEATYLQLYGESYRRLKALRQELDPQRLLNGHIL